MKNGIPTTREPNNPDAFYIQMLYHEWFYGPFASLQEKDAAVAELNKVDPYWDYDGTRTIKGANPLPDDFVNGFTTVEVCHR